jgi:hypothetical protein
MRAFISGCSPVVFGQVEQLVGVEGVAAADEVEPELQAVSGCALDAMPAGVVGWPSVPRSAWISM